MSATTTLPLVTASLILGQMAWVTSVAVTQKASQERCLGACPRITVFSLLIPSEPGTMCVQSDHTTETLSASDGHGQGTDGRTPYQGPLRVHRVPSHRIRP